MVCEGHDCDQCPICKRGVCCRRDAPGYELPEVGSWLGGFSGPLGRVVYDDQGRIVCHVCGDAFESLSRHLLVHNTWAAEYKAYFGLNRKQSLSGLNVKAKQLRYAERNTERLVQARASHSPDWREKLRKPRGPERLQTRAVRANAPPRPPRPEKRKTRFCSVCGNEIPWRPRSAPRTCGPDCLEAVRTARRPNVVRNRPCIVCGKPVIRRHPSRGAPKTCSDLCASRARGNRLWRRTTPVPPSPTPGWIS